MSLLLLRILGGKGPRRCVLIAFCGWLTLVTGRADSTGSWYTSLHQLNDLFSNAAPFAKMADSLDYFTRAFTAIGYGAVMIAAIRRVAKSRTGEESMGWVASTMMTIALMATASSLGPKLFNTCDALANQSSYSEKDAINTCWNSLIVILPGGESPIIDVLRDAQKPPLAPPTKANDDDAPFTKLAWSWMKIAWSTMTDALDKIAAAFRTVLNRIVIIVLLFIPTIMLVMGMMAVELGMLVRELLRQCMDIFLPMMIAFLSFAPMRGAATNYVLKYISTAFWPVAWALGNAIALSLLTSVMQWVVTVCTATSNAVANPVGTAPVPDIGPPSAGLLVSVADFMPWSVLLVIVVVVALTSSLIFVSAVGAPMAFTSMITQGTTFAAEQLGQAMQRLTTNAGSSGSSTSSPSSLNPSGTNFVSTTFSRAIGNLGTAAFRIKSAANGDGSDGVAGMTAGFLARTAGAFGIHAPGQTDGFDGGEDVGHGPHSTPRSTSILETVPRYAASSVTAAPASTGIDFAPSAREFKRSG